VKQRFLIVAAMLLPCVLGAQQSPKQVIQTGTAAPNPNANFSPGVRVGNLLFVSGQLGPLTDSTIQGQTKGALENMKKVLDAAHVGVEDVVKCTVFMTDMKEFNDMNMVYRDFFPADKGRPARSAVQVVALANPRAKVEIECIAAVP